MSKVNYAHAAQQYAAGFIGAAMLTCLVYTSDDADDHPCLDLGA